MALLGQSALTYGKRKPSLYMSDLISEAATQLPALYAIKDAKKQAAEEIAKICNANPDDFTRDSFKARTMSVMNTIVNEGFFADVVVIVEGTSEVGILWKLQEIMKKDWSQLGIVVVPAGGKNNIDRPTVIFRGLSIPTYFIFDADSHLLGKGAKEKDAKDRNHRYLCLAGAPIEDFPETQVHDKWAVFNKNLEGIFKEALGNETFQSILEEGASELGYDDSKRVFPYHIKMFQAWQHGQGNQYLRKRAKKI